MTTGPCLAAIAMNSRPSTDRSLSEAGTVVDQAREGQRKRSAAGGRDAGRKLRGPMNQPSVSNSRTNRSRRCPNGPFGDHMLRVIAELVRTYDFPRLFLDGVSWGVTAAQGRMPEDFCYCPRCRAMWRELFGADIPAQDAPAVRLQFFDFKERVLGAWLDQVRGVIRSSGRKTQNGRLGRNCPRAATINRAGYYGDSISKPGTDAK